MDKDNFLYFAIFTIFFGFLIFILSILNKTYSFNKFLETFFVLFLFSGVILTVLGFIFMLIWYVDNRLPFEEIVIRKQFPRYLGYGALLIVTSFFTIFYISKEKIVYTISMAVAIIGIALLINGLRYFLTEVILNRQRA